MGALEQSWYTKYRPNKLQDYCGDTIKNIIRKRFKLKENFPHVIMLSGERGSGKTTLARLLAKYYHCTNLSEDGPCNECEMCRMIDEQLISGESGGEYCEGVIELDATIMNGKDSIQSVLDDAKLEPIYSDFKVLIVDECHMISSAGQNSMLKIIEDIPAHLVVIFATTNPEKVLQTIKSRCQLTLEIKKQAIKDLVHRLLFISEKEGLTVSEQALEAIAKAGNRVPRECINLLETIAKTYDREVTVENVRDYIGEISTTWYMEYFEASNTGLCDILQFIKKLSTAMSISEFVRGLSEFVMASLYIKHGIALEDYPAEYIKAVKRLFDTYTSNDFDVLIQCIEHLIKSVGHEKSERDEMELLITAMRINKIGALADGLSLEKNQASIENKISLAEHSKSLKTDNIKALEKLKADLSIEEIAETFGDIKVIDNSEGILSDDIIEKVNTYVNMEPEIEEKKNTVEENNNAFNNIDDFFDEDDI